MSLGSKVTTALGETRLLILGAQVLFGFELESVFQGAFSQLAAVSRLMSCAGIALMAIALGLLVVPSMQHRIVERGEDTARILTLTTTFAEAALLPFGASLGLAMYVVFDHLFGRLPAILAGAGFCLLAGVMWFGVEFAIKSRRKERPMRAKPSNEAAPLSAKIDQLLTEARLILPGAQALFGFQLLVTLTGAFEGMPLASRMAHVASLCCVALAVILLMMPAALHRISFAGEDDPLFLQLGSAVVVAATVPLAFGMAGDIYVATAQASQSQVLGIGLAVGIFVTLAVLWYALPIAIRLNQQRNKQNHAPRRR
jgi:hypothetical protein